MMTGMRSRRDLYFVCIAWVLLWRFVPGNGLTLTKLPAPDSNLNVYALPVGQGDCTIIQCPARSTAQHHTGHNYNTRSRTQLPTLLTVVDMGSSRWSRTDGHMREDDVSDFLGNQKQYIEVVAISHRDADHHNYIPTVLPLSALSALKGVYIGCAKNNYSGFDDDTATTNGWLSAVEDSGKLMFASGNSCTTSCGVIQICGGLATLRILGANLDGSRCSNPNSNSLVLRLEYGSFKLLLPGDFQDTKKGNNGVQRMLIDAWRNKPGGIQADFYKIAHHGAYQGGSHTTTLANKDHFLQAVSPKYAFSSSAVPP